MPEFVTGQAWLDRAGLDRQELARMLISVSAEPGGVETEFLLRKLLAVYSSDSSEERCGEAEPRTGGGAGIGIDQRQLLDPDEFGARLQSWAHDGFRPAALDVKIEGLSAVRSVLGRRAESQVGQVLLRRMLGESQVLCVACVTAEDHFFLAEPHSDSWLPRVLGAVQTPILLDDGEVRVNGRFLQERRAM